MKVAYFDCFSGVSGDMILGALIDAGFDLKELKSELGKLKISGYRLRTEKTVRNEISGTKFSVDVTERDVERRLKDIVENKTSSHQNISYQRYINCFFLEK